MERMAGVSWNEPVSVACVLGKGLQGIITARFCFLLHFIAPSRQGLSDDPQEFPFPPLWKVKVLGRWTFFQERNRIISCNLGMHCSSHILREVSGELLHNITFLHEPRCWEDTPAPPVG